MRAWPPGADGVGAWTQLWGTPCTGPEVKAPVTKATTAGRPLFSEVRREMGSDGPR